MSKYVVGDRLKYIEGSDGGVAIVVAATEEDLLLLWQNCGTEQKCSYFFADCLLEKVTVPVETNDDWASLWDLNEKE